MTILQILWTYVSGLVGGLSLFLWFFTGDFACMVVAGTWILIGMFARRINRKAP